MVYYNLSQLWGSVPYITVPATSNNYDEILHSPVRSPQDLCWGLLNELQDITRLPEGGWRITMETVKALRAEIALSLGYNDEAGYLLRDCQSDFSIAVEESSEPEMYRVSVKALRTIHPRKPPCCSKRPVWRTLRTSRPCRTNGKRGSKTGAIGSC